MVGGESKTDIHPVGVINIVFYSVIFNIYLIGVSFALISGTAYVLEEPSLSGLFGLAATAMMIIGTLVAVFRSWLVSLFENLAF